MQLSAEVQQEIAPFSWVEHKDYGSVCLEAGVYLQEVFDTRADEGFEGSGYDWESLARVYLEKKLPDLADSLQFDPEAGMFCVYSKQPEDLLAFIRGFKCACEDKPVILDLFCRAELD